MIKKRFLMLAIMLITTIMAKAQTPENSRSIHFEQQLKWSEILAKAKAEHKYIFVDCYATWCAPCKWMEANVYTQKQVAELYNKTFISLKIQMDKTAADNPLTKSRYDRAKKFADDYHVRAYPTFLFFDPEGNPVHKVAGALDAKEFIQLAADAQNPRKQYYAILKNFKPGSLDTTEEKGIAWSFAASDKQLGGRIAADYLARIPESQLKLFDNARLMVTFQDNPQVCDFAVKILHNMPTKKFISSDNIFFIKALYKQQRIKDLVLAYINTRTGNEMHEPGNVYFIGHFVDDPDVKQIAQSYIDQLTESDWYGSSALDLLNTLTSNTNSNGFAFFYKNATKIDSVKTKGYAESIIANCIYNSEFQTALIAAKANGTEPDFEQMEKMIGQKYSGVDAHKLTLDAKVNWYDDMVNHQKQEAFGEKLVQAEVEKEKTYPSEGRYKVMSFNNICWDIYLHSIDTVMLHQAVRWMKRATESIQPSGPSYYITDTYASVLYKSGDSRQAITVEEQALNAALNSKDNGYAAHARAKTNAMKHGEKIWLEPSFKH